MTPPIETGVFAKGDAKAFVERAGFVGRFERLEAGLFGKYLAGALSLAGLGADNDYGVAVLLPSGDALEEFEAGIGFGVETFLRHEAVAGVAAMMDEAFGVPRDLVDGTGFEPKGGFVEILERGGVGGAFQDGGKYGVRGGFGVSGEMAELGFELRRFDQDNLRAGGKVVGDAGATDLKFHTRRCR